jgi:hypothetical protein
MKKNLIFIISILCLQNFGYARLASNGIAADECSVSDLVRRDELMTGEFDEVGLGNRYFVFGKSGDGCVYKGDYSGGFGPEGHFELRGPECLAGASLWMRTKISGESPFFRMWLERVDNSTNEKIYIFAYRGSSGTSSAITQASMSVMACP